MDNAAGAGPLSHAVIGDTAVEVPPMTSLPVKVLAAVGAEHAPPQDILTVRNFHGTLFYFVTANQSQNPVLCLDIPCSVSVFSNNRLAVFVD